MFDIFKKKSDGENFYPKGPWLIDLGKDRFICENKDGSRFDIDPKTINKIKIITNDKGPFDEDVFWKFEYDEGECYFPSNADNDGIFLEFIQKLSGFNNEEFIKSMSSAEKAVFVIWDRNVL